MLEPVLLGTNILIPVIQMLQLPLQVLFLYADPLREMLALEYLQLVKMLVQELLPATNTLILGVQVDLLQQLQLHLTREPLQEHLPSEYLL